MTLNLIFQFIKYQHIKTFITTRLRFFKKLKYNFFYIEIVPLKKMRKSKAYLLSKRCMSFLKFCGYLQSDGNFCIYYGKKSTRTFLATVSQSINEYEWLFGIKEWFHAKYKFKAYLALFFWFFFWPPKKKSLFLVKKRKLQKK